MRSGLLAAVAALAVGVSGFPSSTKAGTSPNPGTQAKPVVLRTFSARREGPRRVALRWRTSAESGVLGFDVFRRQGGRIVRLSRLSIGARNVAGGASYTYFDRLAGKVRAQYRLEAILLDGTRVWLGSASVRRAS
jgi:hypothetical protein